MIGVEATTNCRRHVNSGSVVDVTPRRTYLGGHPPIGRGRDLDRACAVGRSVASHWTGRSRSAARAIGTLSGLQPDRRRSGARRELTRRPGRPCFSAGDRGNERGGSSRCARSASGLSECACPCPGAHHPVGLKKNRPPGFPGKRSVKQNLPDGASAGISTCHRPCRPSRARRRLRTCPSPGARAPAPRW